MTQDKMLRHMYVLVIPWLQIEIQIAIAKLPQIAMQNLHNSMQFTISVSVYLYAPAS